MKYKIKSQRFSNELKDYIMHILERFLNGRRITVKFGASDNK